MKNANVRHSQWFCLFLTFFTFVLLSSAAGARDATFSWTANSESVDGYRLYYKTGAVGGIPYDGTGATEGNSPVNTGNVTTFTLHNLLDTETYYFVLTAISGTLESDYTTELTLAPLPVTVPPETVPTDVTATFSWLPNQETNLAGYKIHYGTTSGTYATTIDVGNPALVDGRLVAQVDGLTEGTTYYFAATAYDTAGLESDYTPEVVWTATAGTTEPPVVAPPVATDSSFSTTEDQAVSGAAAASNDSGLSISYLVQQDVINGNLLLETGTGSFTYTPNADFAGADSFTFLARDDNGDSNIGTVSISINAINDPPTAENGSIIVNEDSSASGQLQAQDPENDSLTYSAVANPGQGALVLNGTGSFTYTPDANGAGTDSFTFQVSDGQAASNVATISINITAINDPPIVENGTITVNEDSSATGQLQAQDPESDSLTYSVVTNPGQGALVLNGTGSFTYTPDANATGTDSFTFQASDGQAASNVATVSINITAINDPPTAENSSIIVNEYTSAIGQLQAQDPENDSLTYFAVASPAQGTLVLNGTGAFTYTPDANATGTDSFTFEVSDGQVASNIAVVSIGIIPVPQGVTATFSWLPNQEIDLAGYKIHYGTTSGSYTTTVDVGNPAPVDGRIVAQVDGLIEGTTYYFVATAYDSTGLESGYTPEVVWIATAEAQPPSPSIISIKLIQ